MSLPVGAPLMMGRKWVGPERLDRRDRHRLVTVSDSTLLCELQCVISDLF